MSEIHEPPPSPAPVLLVEDNPHLLLATTRMLERANLAIIAAKSVAEALGHIERPTLRLDAAVLDHRLPDGQALPLVRALADRKPTCSSLILTGASEHRLAQQYRGHGAFRYVSKPVAGSTLVAHVHATILDSYRWRRAADEPGHEPPEPPVVVVDVEAATDRLCHIFKLSPTERAVAYWLLLGARDAEIARFLGRAERTAKRHVGQILAKASVANRASLWAALRHDSHEHVDYTAPEPPTGGSDGGPSEDDSGSDVEGGADSEPRDDEDDGRDYCRPVSGSGLGTQLSAP